MERTIRAKFRNGLIEPLEKLDLEEDKEFLITIRDFLIAEDGFKKAMGSWKGTIDYEQLTRDIYESRRLYSVRTKEEQWKRRSKLDSPME